MQHFKELEEKHKRTPVTLDVPGMTGTGVLSLAGDDTEICLLTPELLVFNADEDGLFDLRLQARNAESIFLHNALRLSTTFHGADRKETEMRIFPNFVAFGADHLADDGKLTTITFTLKGLRDFFHYEAIEWQNLSKVTPDVRDALKKLRTLEKQYTRKYEFFYPEELWLLHRMPRILKFKVDDRTYKIHMGFHKSISWSNPKVSVFPVATIEFDEPTTIDDAVDHAWNWRRFFSQIAMEQLPFETISARARRCPAGSAVLYLPNLHEMSPKQHPHSFYPGLAPLNRWKDRRLLAQAMQGWLNKQSSRQLFRVNLERVIQEMNEIASPDHVLMLTAGIESLPEFDSASPYSGKDINTLVEGAVTAAKEAKIKVEIDRLRGLLGLLRKENLTRRVKFLGDTIASLLSGDHDTLVDSVKRIRNARAHGSMGIERLLPKVSATTHALAAMCAIWDQKTSGLPFAKLEGRLNPQIIASEGFRDLAQKESR